MITNPNPQITIRPMQKTAFLNVLSLAGFVNSVIKKPNADNGKTTIPIPNIVPNISKNFIKSPS